MRARARGSAYAGALLFDEIVESQAGTLAGTISSDVAHVLISSKQWRAPSSPKKYGDKLDMNHSGAVGVKIGKEFEGL